MDVVITYVDGNDPAWQRDYEKYADVPVLQKRFRDWGTLKYLLRGIQQNMPFVENVYLVVSHPSQVPEWAGEQLHIVLHKDIIPEEYLPTFNSTTIEMFLHRIEGLSEEFIYFNDDIFPIEPCRAEDFFRDGKAVIGMARHIFYSSMYKKHVRRSDRMARQALGLKPRMCFLRGQHSCIPLLRSQCAEAFEKQREGVLATLSRVRNDGNINMTFFLSYMFHKSLLINERLSCGHLSLALASESKLTKSIATPRRKLLCINDVKLSEASYTTYRELIIRLFEQRFSGKSRFEK